MVEALVAVASAAVGWFIAHVYYRKAATTVPDWFKPILDRLDLPAKPPYGTAAGW